MLLPLVLLIAGIALIYLGARWLVEGASELAAHFGVPPIVIGLTIVGFGSSAPELMLAIVSGAGGSASISVGNVLGANIANSTYILGACVLVAPLLVKFEEIRREAAFMLLALASLIVLTLDGDISRLDGAVLLIIFAAFIVLLLRALYCCRPEKAVAEEFEEARPETEPPLKSVAFVAVGLILLILGTELAVGSAKDIATILGVSEFLIGLTIITFGTTTPEFAISIVSALKGRSDLAMGNIIGTVVFNSTVVLGAGAVIAPSLISESQMVMGFIPQLMFGAILLGVAYRRRCLRRPVGAVFVLMYAVYLAAAILLA